MRPLQPDFMPSGRGLLWAASVFAAMGLAVAVGLGLSAMQARTQALETQAKLSEVRQRIAVEQQRRQLPVPAAPYPYLDDARRVVQIAGMPLDDVLRSLERLRIPGGRVLSLTVQAETRQVRVEVEANDLEQAALVLDQLNAGFEKVRWHWVASRVESGPKPRALLTLESRWD